MRLSSPFGGKVQLHRAAASTAELQGDAKDEFSIRDERFKNIRQRLGNRRFGKIALTVRARSECRGRCHQIKQHLASSTKEWTKPVGETSHGEAEFIMIWFRCSKVGLLATERLPLRSLCCRIHKKRLADEIGRRQLEIANRAENGGRDAPGLEEFLRDFLDVFARHGFQ